MTDKQPKFEQSMQQLETIVNSLERGELPLDEAMQAFEQGNKLVKQCQTQLEQAELKVEKIIAASGETEPFNPAE